MKYHITYCIKKFNSIFKSRCRILKYKKRKGLLVEFKGRICFTCGTYDYFEDLKIVFERVFIKRLYIKEYKQNSNGSYVVFYSFKKPIKIKRDIKIIYL